MDDELTDKTMLISKPIVLKKEHFQHYTYEIDKFYRAENASEHTYRPALKTLIEAFAQGITATNEPRRIACGAPDFIIAQGETPLGYIECKDIGVPLDKAEQSEQMLCLLLPSYGHHFSFSWHRLLCLLRP